MHLRFIASGWDKELDQMERWLGTMVMPMPIKDKKGKKQTVLVPAALRPFRMYDLIFPRDQLDAVLNTLKPASDVALVDGKGTKVFTKTINWIRKFMKLKKLPKPDEKKGFFPHPIDLFKNIRIVGLGTKDDIDFINSSGVEQEGL